ncbi:unnamed protein product, partial [Symbiodinium necroappetens]
MSMQTAELAHLKEAALFAVWKGKIDSSDRPVRLPYATPTEMSSDVTEEIAWEGEDHPFLMARAVLAGDLLRFALCLWLQGIPATAVQVGYPGKLFSLAEHPEKDGNTRIAQIYLDATGDADGVETVDGNLVLKCYQEQTFAEESGDPDYESKNTDTLTPDKVFGQSSDPMLDFQLGWFNNSNYFPSFVEEMMENY